MANLKRVVLKETESEKLNMSSESINNQMNRFDNTYTSKKLNDLYNEFDSITFSDEIENATVVKNDAVDVKASTSFKVNVYLTTAITVVALFAFLAIYNIFVINNLNAGIKMLENNVAESEVVLQNLAGQTSGLTEAELIALIEETYGGEFGEVAQSSIYEIPNITVTSSATTQSSSNWFDSLCSFLCSIFGG